MNRINYLLSLLFVLFAYLQINDLDPALWVTLYLLAASVSYSFAVKKLPFAVSLTWLVALTVIFCFFIPDLIEWVKMGAPDIAGEMKTKEPHIELIREALGLFICWVPALIYTYKLSGNKSRQ